MSEQGKRFNQGKVKLSLLSWIANRVEAIWWMCGELKYGRFQFRRGLKKSEVLDSLKRHIEALERGEEIDPETGQHHGGAIRTNGAILIEQYYLGTGVDDVPRLQLLYPIEPDPKIMNDLYEKYQKPREEAERQAKELADAQVTTNKYQDLEELGGTLDGRPGEKV